MESSQDSTILLVEDDAAHAELIRRTLRKVGVTGEIAHVADGAAALDYLFRRNSYASLFGTELPALILLDLRLPKVDGLEVLREIKQNEELCIIPVVVLTSSEAERDVAKAYDYHVNSYVIKPLSFDRFSELMADITHYWLDWNCPGAAPPLSTHPDA